MTNLPEGYPFWAMRTGADAIEPEHVCEPCPLFFIPRKCAQPLHEERLFDAMDLVLEAYEIGPEPPEAREAVIDVLS